MASNPSTPVDTLEDIFLQNIYDLNIELAKNISTPLDILEKLYTLNDENINSQLKINKKFINMVK